jgi:hypothetical protein
LDLSGLRTLVPDQAAAMPGVRALLVVRRLNAAGGGTTRRGDAVKNIKLVLLAAALAVTLSACEAKLFTSSDPTTAPPITIHIGDGDGNDSHDTDDHHSDNKSEFK